MDKDRDKRLRKNYHVSLQTRQKVSQSQGDCCGICGRHESEFTQPLQVDHHHFKITAVRILAATHGVKPFWQASTLVRDIYIVKIAPTKQKAIQAVKDAALPLSVRGLLCPGRYRGCNRLLGHIDNIPFLEKAIAYLKNPPAHQVIPLDFTPEL